MSDLLPNLPQMLGGASASWVMSIRSNHHSVVCPTRHLLSHMVWVSLARLAFHHPAAALPTVSLWTMRITLLLATLQSSNPTGSMSTSAALFLLQTHRWCLTPILSMWLHYSFSENGNIKRWTGKISSLERLFFRLLLTAMRDEEMLFPRDIRWQRLFVWGESSRAKKNLPAHSSHLGLRKRGTESRAIWSRDLPDYPPWSSELSGQLDHAWRSGSSVENTPAYVSSTGRTKHHPKIHGSCDWSTYLCQKHKWGREYMAQQCGGKWEAVHMQGSTGLGERWRDNVRKLWQESPEGETQRTRETHMISHFLSVGQEKRSESFF